MRKKTALKLVGFFAWIGLWVLVLGLSGNWKVLVTALIFAVLIYLNWLVGPPYPP